MAHFKQHLQRVHLSVVQNKESSTQTSTPERQFNVLCSPKTKKKGESGNHKNSEKVIFVGKFEKKGGKFWTGEKWTEGSVEIGRSWGGGGLRTDKSRTGISPPGTCQASLGGKVGRNTQNMFWGSKGKFEKSNFRPIRIS